MGKARKDEYDQFVICMPDGKYIIGIIYPNSDDSWYIKALGDRVVRIEPRVWAEVKTLGTGQDVTELHPFICITSKDAERIAKKIPGSRIERIP